MSASLKLAALRSQIRALEGHGLDGAESRQVLPFADIRLNCALPGKGLRLGALHEVRAYGLEEDLAAAATAFAASLAGRIMRCQDGFVLWAASRSDCYPPGLVVFGLDPSRILWVDCAKDTEVLGVMEEALQSRSLAVVLGEAGSLSLKAGRRLAAAARQSGTTALLVRRHLYRSLRPKEGPSGAAETRWGLRAVPSQTSDGFIKSPHHSEPGVGAPRWRLDLEYCRNGKSASWIVEAFNGAYGEGCEAGHVCVVAELRDEACPPEAAPARKIA